MPDGRSLGAQDASVFGGSGTRVILDDKGLAQLLESEDGPVGKAVLRTSLQVERRAKQGAPVDTGRLRSSVTHAVEKRGREIVGVVGTNVVYAPYVELGTSRTQAKPFLRSALAAVRGLTPGGSGA
ncbi:MAG: HK97-gp10 family putative phage morphogenesis protein [Acidimicrobiales bacterium]